MKKQMHLIAASFVVAAMAQADLTPGPNGGRIIGEAPDRAEFLIGDDQVASIAFLDDDGQVAEIGDRVVRLFAQRDTGREEIALRREGDRIVSEAPLPQPEGYLLVVQIRAHADARPVNARIRYLTHKCGSCRLGEYACICEGH